MLSNPSRLVMKFGGTSVADVNKIKKAALHVKREYQAGRQVAVVVSAMAGVTNQLINYCREASPLHDAREYDAVVATGEQITAGLMAIALQEMGISSRSWAGWQIPVSTSNDHTAARIDSIKGDEIIRRMEENEVAVVTGFQGISPRQRITTLGRGGSDTSAVALAIALKADRCDIYTDVDGIYSTDPRVESKAKRIPRISFEEMLEMASQGAKVLQVRSVELAMCYEMPLVVRSTFASPDEDIDLHTGGSLVCKEDQIMEKHKVTGVTSQDQEAEITLRALPDQPGIASKIFGPLAEKSINVDMIIQSIAPDSKTVDMTFTLPQADLEEAVRTLNEHKDRLDFKEISAAGGLVKVSVVGMGMRSHAGVASKMFDELGRNNINIRAISTSEIKISVLIEPAYKELAIRCLHKVFDLG